MGSGGLRRPGGPGAGFQRIPAGGRLPTDQASYTSRAALGPSVCGAPAFPLVLWKTHHPRASPCRPGNAQWLVAPRRGLSTLHGDRHGYGQGTEDRRAPGRPHEQDQDRRSHAVAGLGDASQGRSPLFHGPVPGGGLDADGDHVRRPRHHKARHTAPLPQAGMALPGVPMLDERTVGRPS